MEMFSRKMWNIPLLFVNNQTFNYLTLLFSYRFHVWSREVNEDNVLFRNVLMEFEESFKYVSYAEKEYNFNVEIQIQIHRLKYCSC